MSSSFPKFAVTVDASRIPPLPQPAGTDILSRQPLDIIRALLPYLPTPAYLALTSTCRTLRHHAVTTFQPEARRRVLGLRWAVPLPYEAQLMQKAGLVAASADAPAGADWLLYMSFVHRTAGMRARRWIWGMAEEITNVYRKRKAESPYADIVLAGGEIQKSKARTELEKKVESMNFMGGNDVGAMSMEEGMQQFMSMMSGGKTFDMSNVRV